MLASGQIFSTALVLALLVAAQLVAAGHHHCDWRPPNLGSFHLWCYAELDMDNRYRCVLDSPDDRAGQKVGDWNYLKPNTLEICEFGSGTDVDSISRPR